jgi:L,D-transpeptidase YcbB
MIFRSLHFWAFAAILALQPAWAAAQDIKPPLPSDVPPPAVTPQAVKPAAPAPVATPAPTAAPAASAPAPTTAPASNAAASPGSEPAPVPIPTTPNNNLLGMPAPNQAAAPPKPKKIVHPAPPRETALSTDPNPTFQPNTFFTTAKASERYGAIADAGGWPTVPTALKPGSRGPAVATLRKRLAAEGDLEGAKVSGDKWDDELTAAVKHFQSRMGLRETGIVAGATLKAMNVPASIRFKQLASSAQRLAGVNFPFDNRYVVVNIPSLSVEAIENGRVAHHYVAIVGDVEHQSPEISAKISVINLNPTWTVPTSIIKKEIIPKMQRDPGYLSRAKIRILDGAGNVIDPKSINWSTERAVNYTLRQDSGASNSLGSIRIGMPNKLAVYMHDTPSKNLFGADYRFLSHGCVRVQGVYDLAEWLLQGTPGGPAGGAWDKQALLDKIKQGEREDIKLAKVVPVIWVYLTGWSNADGTVNFRDDVYGVDTVGEASASAVPTAAAAPAQVQ